MATKAASPSKKNIEENLRNALSHIESIHEDLHQFSAKADENEKPFYSQASIVTLTAIGKLETLIKDVRIFKNLPPEE